MVAPPCTARVRMGQANLGLTQDPHRWQAGAPIAQQHPQRSQPRETGAVKQNSFFSSLQTLSTTTHIHVLIFELNFATTRNRPATFSIEQKIPKPWETEGVHLLELLSTSILQEQLHLD